MPDSSDLAAVEQALIDAAQAPASSSVGAESVTEHSIDDLIKADRYLAQKGAATTTKTSGLRFVKLVPPGAV